LPAAHAVHDPEPEDDEYVPAAHGVQVLEDKAPIAAEYEPAAHRTQTVDLTLLAYLPAEQEVQLPAPLLFEYEPAVQFEQVICFAVENLPAAH
jgi:hypothetical protein